MNGDNATNPAATNPTARPSVRNPNKYVNGTAAAPATSDGNRNHSADTTPTRVANHDNTKNNGGVISASVCTVDTTPHNPFDDTTQYVDNSSANTD